MSRKSFNFVASQRTKVSAMKLTLDVKSIQYKTNPVSPLYDPQKTSFTCTAKAIIWTINGTDPAFCVSAFSGGAKSENDFPTKK
jgi:hypothetical protein